MRKEYDQLLEALWNEPLSDGEKAAMRSRLVDYMRENPARAPFYIRALDYVSSAKTFAFVQNPRLQFVAATVALVFAAGGGTAYAAGGALPGEPLYGIKINIEEPLQGALQTSPQAQAQWNAQLAARRLAEAEQLAAQNKLTPATESVVAVGLDQATNNFDASVSQLAATSSNVAVVANLESGMEATLAANTQVLNELADAVPASAQTIQPLLSRARDGAASLDTARTELDAVAARSNVAQVQAATEAQLDAAQTQLNSITVSSSTVASQTKLAQEAIQAGQENLSTGNYQAALETSQAAAFEAQAAQLDETIGGTLHVQIAATAFASTSAPFSLQASSTSAEAISTSSADTDVLSHATSSAQDYRDPRVRN